MKLARVSFVLPPLRIQIPELSHENLHFYLLSEEMANPEIRHIVTELDRICHAVTQAYLI